MDNETKKLYDKYKKMFKGADKIKLISVILPWVICKIIAGNSIVPKSFGCFNSGDLLG